MRLLRFVVRLVTVAIMVLGTSVVSSQDYPNRPIRIVTAGLGGSLDFTARIIAQGLSGPLGQPVIVHNRGGADGIVAGETVAKAPSDGYTLLLHGSTIWLLPFLQDNVPYNAGRDFSPITLATRSPSILVVHPSLAVNSAGELIALAKAKPGALNYAASATGGTSHLAAELFKALAGVNIVRVRYKDPASAQNDLISGQVQLAFYTPISVMPLVKSGRVRALAITSAAPSALAPGLPTVAASGLPGYESGASFGVFAPAKTPGAIIKRLNEEIVRILRAADAKEKFLRSGLEPVGSSPAEFAEKVRSETARMGKVIKDAGIRSE